MMSLLFDYTNGLAYHTLLGWVGLVGSVIIVYRVGPTGRVGVILLYWVGLA